MKQSETVSIHMRNIRNVSPSVRIVSLLISFTLLFLFTSVSTLAKVQYYEINTELTEDGLSKVKMILTFSEPEDKLSFNIIGRVENFTASSSAGPINCKVDVMGVSSINCDINLTKEKRQIELRFVTLDFIRNLGDKIFFSGDFSLNREIDVVSASLKLPPGALLVGGNVTTSMLSFSNNASIFIAEDGRTLVNWNLNNIEEGQSLKLEALYQQVQEPMWFQILLSLRIRYVILFGAVFAFVLGFVIIRHFRKSEKLVLSVLDEYERRIVNILIKEENIKQKKLVEMTNLSKAKVSRVVKSLSERGLLDVERRGRTNLLKLKKKKLSAEF